MSTTRNSGNSGEKLKRAALWVLAAAVTVFMNTLTGMLITLVVMIPVFVIIALKTPRKLP
jgi:Flp pilus assembly protein TadB